MYLVNYSTFKGSFHDSAVKLKTVIETNNLRDVILVGMSYGSVSCFLYLQNLDGWKRTKGFISIGGTFSGTPLSRLFAFFNSGAEMIPNSRLVGRIRKMKVKKPERIWCVRALFDEMVPSSSSELAGAHTVVAQIIGHNNLHVYAPAVFKLIAQKAKE